MVGRFVGMLNQRSTEVKQDNIKQEKAREKKENRQLSKKLKAEVKVGDRIKVLETGMKGVISEIRKDRYHVTIGSNISTQLSREQFIPDTPVRSQGKPGPGKRPGKS